MSNSGKPNLGEISTIRNILMGDQMDEYNARLESLSDKVRTTEAQMEKLQKEHETQLQTIRSQMEEQIATLTKQLQEHQEGLQEQISAISKDERQRLGQMLSEIGQQISNS